MSPADDAHTRRPTYDDPARLAQGTYRQTAHVAINDISYLVRVTPQDSA